ncbi:RNA ligase family protein [Nonomuraea sp. NPDC049141]|uniref:RNA ligase family protein n=1 Tax=Nonomuraea sp. NPDC049141 TaxID=3155500 RepID=UPI0033C3CCB7
MTTDITFAAWPKTPRLFDVKGVTITEKLDGTNAAVIITEDGQIGAQSRKRLLPMGPRGMDDVSWQKEDNAGFAAWVRANRDGLVAELGPGRHYGEWWGSGIQRAYGLAEKRFSLFNTAKWSHFEAGSSVPGLGVVPVLYDGPFTLLSVEIALLELALNGSKAAPGWARPEGICVYHKAAARVFKVLLDK